MAITNLPTPPARSDTPTNFITKADAFIAALPLFVTESNAQAAALTLNSTNDTSSTSNIIGTGAKTFTVSSGKSFQPGMYLVIADTAAPSTNSMFGQVTSYSGTSLIINILSVRGSGTKASWTISQSSAGGATLDANAFTAAQTLASGAALNESISTLASSATPDIWTTTSNLINYTGTTAATGFAAAPQAGARRTLILAGAASFTAGADMLIDGVVSFTGAAGDEVEVFAVTTTQFRLRPKLASGSSLPAGTLISFAGTSAPSGYLACPLTLTNISRTTYAALFAAIGITWGAGDGSTTFGLPWFPADYAAVQSNGNVGTNSVGQNLAHTHTSNVQTATQLDSNSVGGGSPTNGGTQQTASSGGTANLAAGVRILRCIKY